MCAKKSFYFSRNIFVCKSLCQLTILTFLQQKYFALERVKFTHCALKHPSNYKEFFQFPFKPIFCNSYAKVTAISKNHPPGTKNKKQKVQKNAPSENKLKKKLISQMLLNLSHLPQLSSFKRSMNSQVQSL